MRCAVNAPTGQVRDHERLLRDLTDWTEPGGSTEAAAATAAWQAGTTQRGAPWSVRVVRVVRYEQVKAHCVITIGDG